MKKKTIISSSKAESPSRLIDARIKELDDWRGETLSRLRALIKQADPAVAGEITDKGSINQRAVLKARAAQVEALYEEPGSRVVLVEAAGRGPTRL